MEVEINDYIGVFRGAASENYCARMIAEFDRIADRDVSCVNHGETQFGNATGRKDQQVFFEAMSPDLAEETNRILDACLLPYMDEYVGLKDQQFTSRHVKVQRTPPKGGYHIWHCEQGSDSIYSASRMLVWTLYLNDIPDGQGETEFLHQGVRLKPEKGMVCFFPASWTHVHRGNFTTTATKYIATGWYNLI